MGGAPRRQVHGVSHARCAAMPHTLAGGRESLYSPLDGVCHARTAAHERIDALAILLVEVGLELRELLVPERG
eukprot:365920-Chlamydomonas_euryale.AAC.16